MHRYRWIALGTLVCLAFAAAAYFWANALVDSLYAYPSPLETQTLPQGQPVGAPLTRRVVWVLVDALRADTAADATVMPNLNRLRQQGASSTLYSLPPSYSQPGWATLLTGAWPDTNGGAPLNLDYDELRPVAMETIFAAAKTAGHKTAISGYYWFDRMFPPGTLDAVFGTEGEDEAADRAVMDAARPWLQPGEFQLVLIHFDQVDYAGEKLGGPRAPAWNQAAAVVDAHIGEIAAALDFSQDTLLITSDHGQIDAGGHGGYETVTLREPFVLLGPAVRPGQYPLMPMIDVAPTLAVMLGTHLPAASLGTPQTAMLNLSVEQQQAVSAALAAQREGTLLPAYSRAISPPRKAIRGWNDLTGTAREIMEQQRGMRLQRERWPRTLLALVIGLAPLAVLEFRRGKNVHRWLVLAALLYLALFNLRYLLLDGRTYSFSSVDGTMDLILTIGGTSALALLVTWAAYAWAAGLYRLPPLQSAQRALSLALVIIYILFIPVLWHFAINGAVTTWTLPQFGAHFFALASLVQILFVALVGLLLAGISAVRLRQKA